MRYTHPNTRCDRAERNHVVNTADIKATLKEYWQRCDEIWQSLPLTFEGTTYTHWWQMNFEDSVLPMCRTGKPSQRLLEAYTYLPLNRLFRGLEERAGP